MNQDSEKKSSSPSIKYEEDFRFERIETAPFGANAYILVCRKTNEGVLIDAPGEASRIASRLKDVKLRYILLTHGHFDHTGALLELRSQFQALVACHMQDAERIPTPPHLPLQDGQDVSFGKLKLHVFHTPGHTPGSVCFLIKRYLFSGDTLFPNGPGKTNSPDDFKKIIRAIKEKLFTLPENVLIYPGHGESTSIKREKKKFAEFASRSHPDDMFGEVLWKKS